MDPKTPKRRRLSMKLAKTLLLVAGFLALLRTAPTPANAAQEIIVVPGHPGSNPFGPEIEATASRWIQTASAAGHQTTLIPPSPEAPSPPSQLERLRSSLLAAAPNSPDPLWIVLLGHGTAQARSPKFNLTGPDLAAEELARLVSRFQRPLIIFAGFSASGAFLKPLSAPNRIIVCATKSGSEENWTRFPRLFTAALSELDADSDGDGQVSVHEAWQHATQAVESFYRGQNRIPTEHSTLADNTPSAAGSGIPDFTAQRWSLRASPEENALTPNQRTRREMLENQLAALRKTKDSAEPAQYSRDLEKLLLELARLYSP
jgi:hypothetical protein